MINLKAGGYNLYELLAAPPNIEDSIDGICRKLTFTLKDKKLGTGELVELYFNGKREFYGHIRRRRITENGQVEYTAYDPLFLLKSEDDWHFKKQTLTQAYKTLLSACGIRAGKIANTKVVLPQLWYRASEASKALVDIIARQRRLNSKIYLPRFNPSTAAADLIELDVPKTLWAFQVGVNLTAATYEEDAESLVTQVKLVNRENGKTVTKVNAAMKAKYGKIQEFIEVDKEQANQMDQIGAQQLAALSKLPFTANISGVNPATMPIFFSGDVVYVEEKFTKMMGGYHIRNATHSFEDDQLVTVSFDLQKSAFVPDIQVEDATTDPAKATTEAPKKQTAAEKVSGKREAVVTEAKKWVGKLKYSWGGKNIPGGSGDCSGFTYYVFNKAAGVSLGHGTATQINKGKTINKNQATAGDLVFFKGTIPERGPNAVSHVGIVTRPGYCISLASSGCKEHSYTTGYWGQHFMKLTRVLE